MDDGRGDEETITVHDLDDEVIWRLRVRAMENQRSMEAEVRAILTSTVTTDYRSTGLGQAIRQFVSELGGVELDVARRADPARPPGFAVDAASECSATRSIRSR